MESAFEALPVDKLKSAGQDLIKALVDRAVSAALEQVDGLTDRLGDVAENGGEGLGSALGGGGAGGLGAIPAEPADPTLLPPALAPFGAVPPLVTDIDLSVDDRFLYVSCWGTGELKQYDVSDPAHPREVGSVRLGGIVGQRPAPRLPRTSRCPAGRGLVEVSRDGSRVYVTNSLYGSWDDQFYPDGVGAWMAKLDVRAGWRDVPDPRFFPRGDEFRGLRVHQVRLQGGDASSRTRTATPPERKPAVPPVGGNVLPGDPDGLVGGQVDRRG